MKTLRYQTWRRVFVLGVVGLWLPFLAPVFSLSEGWITVGMILGGVVVAASAVFLVGVWVLRRLGQLEFSYSEKDHSSYLYNAEKLGQQIQEARRAKKRE